MKDYLKKFCYYIDEMYRGGSIKISEPIGGQGGRDTGMLGTGIYLYKENPHYANESYNIIDTNDLCFYRPACDKCIINTSNLLNNALYDPNQENMIKAMNEWNEYEAFYNRSQLTMRYDEISDVLKKINECIIKHGDKKCIQPITLFLKNKGFDGLIPSDYIASDNMWGSIIFPNSVNIDENTLDLKITKII